MTTYFINPRGRYSDSNITAVAFLNAIAVIKRSKGGKAPVPFFLWLYVKLQFHTDSGACLSCRDKEEFVIFT